jgi:uncharacterized membrane protein YraQ (UPF0718 family)
MLPFFVEFAQNTWSLVAQMAPYLIIGFAIAGVLHLILRKEAIEHWLGKPGLGGVVKASILGVPMPLCSCSVIPVAASLRKSGASRGATASFLSSTPQTGVDSIVATYALLGGAFSAVRVAVAFICGIITGYLIELFSKDKTVAAPVFLPANTAVFSMTAPSTTPSLIPEGPSCCSIPKPKRSPLEAIRYGFITLPAELGQALLFGLILAGLITTLLPSDFLTGTLSSGPLAFLLATAISLPLYVCATASIPMAYALMAAGLSPGAALVFLITGPATNTATIVTIWKMLGRLSTTIYLTSLLLISWLAGWLFNASLQFKSGQLATQDHLHLSTWHHASGFLLLAILLISLLPVSSARKRNCCSE